MSTTKLLKTSTIYVLLGFLAPAVNFILLPIYAHYLLPEDYALITLATLVQAVLVTIIGLGSTGGFARLYYDFHKDAKEVQALFNSSFLIIICSAIVVLLLAAFSGNIVFSWSFKNDVFTFSRFGYMVLFTAIMANAQLLILSFYRNEEKVTKYAFWSVFFFLSSATGIFIGVVVLEKGAVGSIYGRTYGLILPVICFLIWHFSRGVIAPQKKMLRHLLVYGFPLVPYLLLNVAFNNADKMFIERYFSLDVLGKYGFAVLIVSVIEIFNNAISSATFPSLYRKLAEEKRDSKGILDIFRMILLTSFTINALIVGLGCLAIVYFINPKYHEAVQILPLIAATYIPRAHYIVYSVGVMYNKQTKVLPLINGTSFIVCLIVNFSLVHVLGWFAMPVGLFVCQMVMVGGAIFFNKRKNADIPELHHLKKENLLGLLLLLLTAAATLLYNLLSPNVMWYFGVLVIYALLVVGIYKDMLKRILGMIQAKLKPSKV